MWYCGCVCWLSTEAQSYYAIVRVIRLRAYKPEPAVFYGRLLWKWLIAIITLCPAPISLQYFSHHKYFFLFLERVGVILV